MFVLCDFPSDSSSKKESGAAPILEGCERCSEILKGGSKILFCGRGMKFFSALRDTNSNTWTGIDLFQLNTLNGTAKAPAVDFLRLNTQETLGAY